MEKKIVGVIGGMLGDDPFSERAWSGSSKSIFEACNKLGILDRAFGVSIKKTFDYYYLLATNFSINRRKWVSKFYLDPRHNTALTKQIAKCISMEDMNKSFLQLGSIYDVPSVLDGRTSCYLYADANVSLFMKSPFCSPEMRKYAQKAFKWEQKVHDGMSKIFTFSDYVRRSFIDDFNIDASRVKTVGVGTNWRAPDFIEKDYSKKEIVFIGIDFERKGGNILLKAFKNVKRKYPDSILHIIGPRQKPLGIDQEGVIFHGFLSNNVEEERKKVERILSSSTLGVLPSRWEPFGIAVLEYMVYGMPCITTNKWAFPEMIKPGTSGELINVDDVDDLTDKMCHYLSDDDLREEHGTNARNYVIENYGWDIVANEINKEI